MSVEAKPERIDIFVAECPTCGRRVKGFTKRQAERNLANHMLTHR